ncbi:zinc-dependent alcohol dehydrogenase family protein [Marinicrinis lubricantis]|uniref:Zinc-dependent alcohol dehydrogenase family protein n=1 Tax=Marinicrinis lubricantis TaxID=2086470 RepID=A0ABW1IKN7_9BACL
MEAKCVTHHKFGIPREVLRIEHKTVQPPDDNDVLVRMLVRPINPSDLIPIRGSYSHRIELPNIPGYEGVGIIEDVGANVSKGLIGKRVLPLRGEGTWQQFVRTSADFAVAIPDTIDATTASQLYINPLTAWVICTEVLKLQSGDTVLVNAGGSSIGRVLAQLSRIIGFQLIAITRHDGYTKDLLRLGAAHVINTSEYPLFETVMQITKGMGADGAIDSVGGPAGNELASCLRPAGHFLSIGLLSGVQINWKEIFDKKNIHAGLFHLRGWNKTVSKSTWQDTFNRLIAFIADNKIEMMPAAFQYDLEQVAEAVRAVETSEYIGKAFLTSEGSV